MRLFFADDSKQRTPHRSGMGSLEALGGVSVDAGAVRDLERAIHALCSEYGLPERTEFKWSPGGNHWMHDNLTGERRIEFFQRILAQVADRDGKAIVVLEDTTWGFATSRAGSTLEDLTSLLLERINLHFHELNTSGIVIVDQPAGGRKEEKSYLVECLETLITGTEYQSLDRLMLNVLSTSSELTRMLQVADLITGSTLARIADIGWYAPHVFEFVRPLFYQPRGRVGGAGVKIHPDMRYMNLYHWLLGDEHGKNNETLPSTSYPYCHDEYDA